jgi:hypothetical protein
MPGAPRADTILVKAKVRLRGYQVPEVTLEAAFAKTLQIAKPDSSTSC